MKTGDYKFNRRFSVNLYRNLSLPLAEMSLHKDWVNTGRGEPYPTLSRTGSISESVCNGAYRLSSDCGGSVTRLLGSFFPYATYTLNIEYLFDGLAGFEITNDDGFSLSILAGENDIYLSCGETDLTVSEWHGGILSFTFRFGGVSIYERNGNGHDTLLADIPLKELESLLTSSAFGKTRVGVAVKLPAGGSAILSGICASLNCGISQADIKPVKYENGEIFMRSGRVFLTASARLEVGCYQIVLSWCPTTADFKMEGAIFYDCGDGKWCNDVALSLIFDRKSNKWLYWMCAFSHGHILGRGETANEPLYGINLLKVCLMESPSEAGDTSAFAGIAGDEDPDLIYENGAWHLSVCRLERDGAYHYRHFVSEKPLDGFSCVDCTPTGEKTGGMFCRIKNGLYFICGSDFNKRAIYDIYPFDDFSRCSHLRADFDDGGFRGWGSVFELPCGSEARAVWITFDRHNGSAWNWSYGNIYVFDMLPE